MSSKPQIDGADTGFTLLEWGGAEDSYLWFR